MMHATLRTFALRISLLASAAVLSLAAPASAQVLNFDNVTTNAGGFNSSAFTNYNGYTFENFGVMTSASPFGIGDNAVSPTKFAYGQADDAAFIYRTDIGFNFFSAFLSYRRLDANIDPVDIIINGYRAGDINPTFSQVVTLTNTAQRFIFDFTNIEEIEFDTDALDNGRAAVLAMDDANLATVPEPSTIVLVASGLLGMGVVARRRRV